MRALRIVRRGGGCESGFGGIDKPSAIGAAALIASGAALTAWAWLSQSSAPAAWTTLGLSAIGSGAVFALWSALGE